MAAVCSVPDAPRRALGEDIRIVDLFALLGALHSALVELLHKVLAVRHRFPALCLFIANTHSGLKPDHMNEAFLCLVWCTYFAAPASPHLRGFVVLHVDFISSLAHSVAVIPCLHPQ
jgi:uncharacterized protein Usg